MLRYRNVANWLYITDLDALINFVAASLRRKANRKKAMHIWFYADASAHCDAPWSNVRSGLCASFNWPCAFPLPVASHPAASTPSSAFSSTSTKPAHAINVAFARWKLVEKDDKFLLFPTWGLRWKILNPARLLSIFFLLFQSPQIGPLSRHFISSTTRYSVNILCLLARLYSRR